MSVRCPVCGGDGYERDGNGVPVECDNCDGKGYLQYIPTKEDEDETDNNDE